MHPFLTYLNQELQYRKEIALISEHGRDFQTADEIFEYQLTRLNAQIEILEDIIHHFELLVKEEFGAVKSE